MLKPTAAIGCTFATVPVFSLKTLKSLIQSRMDLMAGKITFETNKCI